MGRAPHMGRSAGCKTGAAASALARALFDAGTACAIIDRQGIVQDASEALKAITPDIAGRPFNETFEIDLSELLSQTASHNVTFAVYADPTGARVPARLQTLFEFQDSGCLLILVFDGAPFRDAELERFESASHAIMRVDPRGAVTHANKLACSALAERRDSLVGCRLDALFRTSEPTKIADSIDRCLSNGEAVPLEVSGTPSTDGKEEPLSLLMTPDFGPGRCVLGAFVLIRLSLVESVRDDIAKIARDPSIQGWEKRLELIVANIRRLFDFDHAIFGMYAENVTRFRAFATFPHDRMKWSERWLKLPPDVRDRIQSGVTTMDDLRERVRQQPTLAESEVVQMYLNKQIRSSVSLQAMNASEPMSALSFCSKQVGRFDSTHAERLRDLDLEPVLIRIEEQIIADRSALGAALRDELAKATSLPAVACRIVDRIAAELKLDHVALFRVNRQMARFELVHQSPYKKQFRIAEPYFQKIEEGMLARTLRERSTLVLNDIGSSDVEQYDYLSLGRDVHSAMTIPIYLNGRIRWILNLETRVAHAFYGPDIAAIDDIVKALEDGLRRHTDDAISRLVLEHTEQGVVTVGMEGAILHANAAAERLLGRKTPITPDAKPVYLSDYAAQDDPHALAALRGLGGTDKRCIELKGDDGQIRPVLATRLVLDSSFDTALWFLIDLRSDRWTIDMRFLRETVSDVAQQTRASLALASNLARKLPMLWSHSPSDPDAEARPSRTPEQISQKLLEEIGKADITFERLAGALAIRREPARMSKMTTLDLWHCVDEVIASLPERDRSCIDATSPSRKLLIHGDAERIAFVVRSVVAHLLRVRPEDEDTRVSVALSSHSDEALLTLALTRFFPAQKAAQLRTAPDALRQAYQAARDDASLSLDTIKLVIDAHHGSLMTRAAAWATNDLSPPWMAFQIALPVFMGEAGGA